MMSEVVQDNRWCTLSVPSLLIRQLYDVSVVVGGASGLLDVLRGHAHAFQPAGDVPATSGNREQLLESGNTCMSTVSSSGVAMT